MTWLLRLLKRTCPVCAGTGWVPVRHAHPMLPEVYTMAPIPCEYCNSRTWVWRWR